VIFVIVASFDASVDMSKSARATLSDCRPSSIQKVITMHDLTFTNCFRQGSGHFMTIPHYDIAIDLTEEPFCMCLSRAKEFFEILPAIIQDTLDELFSTGLPNVGDVQGHFSDREEVHFASKEITDLSPIRHGA
jgi:hypothetical protein